MMRRFRWWHDLALTRHIPPRAKRRFVERNVFVAGAREIEAHRDVATRGPPAARCRGDLAIRRVRATRMVSCARSVPERGRSGAQKGREGRGGPVAETSRAICNASRVADARGRNVVTRWLIGLAPVERQKWAARAV